MKEVKIKKNIFIAVFMVLLIGGGVIFTSANLLNDFANKLTGTGKATSGSANVNVQVGNSAPSIFLVQFSPVINPNENNYRIAYISFQAEDMNGIINLNFSSAKIIVSKSGDVTKTSSCVNVNNITSKIANFSCSVNLWYFETAGNDWNINVSISDLVNLPLIGTKENSSNSFTYSELTAMVFAPLSMNWSAIEVTDVDTLSTSNPMLINNTGNDNITLGNIKMNATDLEGEDFAGEYIYAGNFTINVANSCNTGTFMNNGVTLNITNAQLSKGNHSINDGSTGQEQLYFCLEAINDDISAQTYSTTAGGPWTLSVQ